ncbi:enoyl-CoA hydratase/isomerase family protein [Streptomyces sp. NPDC020845]|uniref:enoyl-CoA hydratase/isomerase family protein n=1 Tax=Streptomyces sp. NPDC020845 TaxID=3365096 RepID=UPI00378E8993
MDRPWVRNAVDAATRDALCEALEVAVADPSITVVDLHGHGPAFCSGGDLAEFGTARDPAEAHRVRVHRSPAALLQRCGPKVTAHLHGACVGAGIELAAFAGRVLAAPDTVIRLPETEMGLIPGAGGTASLPPRIGRERTASTRPSTPLRHFLGSSARRSPPSGESNRHTTVPDRHGLRASGVVR